MTGASRRRFLSGLAAALAAPSLVRAQAKQSVRRVGILFAGVPGASSQLQGLYDGLTSLGWLDGKNIQLMLRAAEGRTERLPQLAAELVALKPDVIVAATTPGVAALKPLTQTIPVVMVAVGDPVGSKLVASLAQPGGNITGPTVLNRELSGKRVELLKETIPAAGRMAVLWNPLNQQSNDAVHDMEGAVATFQLELLSFPVRSPDDLPSVLDAVFQSRPSALMVISDALTYSFRKPIIDATLQRRLPGFFTYPEEVSDGGLLSYGVNLREEFRRAAIYVDKILNGATPAKLPVERPTRFELVVNMKTANAIGVAVPRSILLRADRVID